MSDAKQTFRVTATPRERFQLASLLFNQALKGKTIREDKDMYQARKSLGLLSLSDLMLDKGRADDEYAKDHSTRHVFTVTRATADYVCAAREKVELEPHVAHMLVGLVMALHHGEDSPDADTAPALDEQAEFARWKPSLRPVLKQPDKFLDAFGDVLARASVLSPVLKGLHELYVAGMAEPKPEPPNGHAAAPAESAPT